LQATYNDHMQPQHQKNFIFICKIYNLF
jgi:hypothetical protein